MPISACCAICRYGTNSMATYLELNDWQLGAIGPTGRASDSRALGGALASNGDLVFGETAWAESRMQPLKFNHRYISNLNAEPISGDLGKAKNHADLIYHHLRALDLPGDPLVLAVPGYVSNQQLGLLLGICEALELEVLGFIDAPLAYTLATGVHGRVHVLDVELHRLSLTVVEQDDNTRTASTCLSFEGCGMSNIADGWMNAIADEFVSKTRFDPLHAAASEQQLFNQVVGWFASPLLDAKSISVEVGDTRRDIEIGAARLAQKLEERLAVADLQGVSTLALTPRALRIPGLRASVDDKVGHVIELDEQGLYERMVSLGGRLRGTEVTRIRHIDVRDLPRSADVVAPTAFTPAATAATHLLEGHTAWPITSTKFASVTANGSAIAPGDRVEIEGVTYVGIQVE